MSFILKVSDRPFLDAFPEHMTSLELSMLPVRISQVDGPQGLIRAGSYARALWSEIGSATQPSLRFTLTRSW